MKSPIGLQLVPAHVHTSYSVLDGASGIDEYVAWAKENGSPALGITDHGWMIGLLELIQKCKAAGLAALPGCELYVIPEKGYEFNKKPYDYYHVTAWAVNERGYRNLLKLGSLSFTKTFPDGQKRVVKKVGVDKPRVTFDELLEHNEGLVLGSGCLIGSVNKALLQGEPHGAEKNLLKLLEVYRGRFFLEIMPHECTHDFHRKTKSFVHNECTEFSPDGDLQRACNLANIDLSKKHRIPLILTVDSHFVKPEQKAVQDVLLQNGDPDGWRFYTSYHMLTTQQAWDHWSVKYPGMQREFCEAVENNHVLADLAKGLEVNDHFRQPEVFYPPEISSAQVSESEKLKMVIFRKIQEHGRMRWNDSIYEDRLRKELKVVCDNGIIDFAPYFLFLEHWGAWTRDHSVLSAPGRGSGAGSLICYLLKITHLDPIELDLPFERFLSMGRLRRGKFPDIDWDMGQRDVLIAKLAETYGDRFAQCSTHGTLKVKSAIKDACRVLLGLNGNDPKIDSVTKTIPMTPTGVKDRDFLVGYKDLEGNVHQGQIEANPVLKKFFDEHPAVYDMVLRLLGIPRSVGRHASAYFVSDRSISDSVPTCQISGQISTQYTAVPAEKAGLIKFDFLGINTLLDIPNCIRLVQKKMGQKIWKEKLTIAGQEFVVWRGERPVEEVPMPDGSVNDIYRLPSDEAVFKDFDLGKTETVFQMNTPLLTGFCKRVKPRSIQDLSALVALVRPGPLTAPVQSGSAVTMTEAFIARKNGLDPVSFVHPGLEPILKDTYGVVVYQEQLARIFSDLAGYSAEEADQIRELIAKKKKQDMESAIPEIRRRLAERGLTESQTQMIVDVCISSASYSFNRSHSFSYAIVAYQCAFLKHHFPLEWWTAVLQNAKTEDIRDKAYAHAVKDLLVLPRVNGPTNSFELIDGKIHAPLYLVEGVGDTACRAIESARAEGGPFKSFQDFYERVDHKMVNQTVIHALAVCGAFAEISVPGTDPRDLLWLYHAFKRVEGLKVGRGKTGEDLLKAVSQYLESGKTVDVPVVYSDDVEIEVQRLALLPIYRLDAHDHFKKLLEAKTFLYDRFGGISAHLEGQSVKVIRNLKEIPALKVYEIGWVGLVQGAEEFRYKDKKTQKQVAALKMHLVNDGDALECIIWPDTYTKVGPPNERRLIFAKGILRESREPGRWSMYVQTYVQF